MARNLLRRSPFGSGYSAQARTSLDLGDIDYDEVSSMLDEGLTPSEIEKQIKAISPLERAKYVPSKNPRDLGNSLIQLPKVKITKETLDDEIKQMFKNRKEGLDYINSNFVDDEKGKNNALERLNRVYPRRVKGASPEYAEKVNARYNEVLPLLKEKGYNVNEFTNDNIANYLDKFFSDYHKDRDEINKTLSTEEINKYWNENYKNLFEALMAAENKLYTDDFIKKAPYGYEED